MMSIALHSLQQSLEDHLPKVYLMHRQNAAVIDLTVAYRGSVITSAFSLDDIARVEIVEIMLAHVRHRLCKLVLHDLLDLLGEEPKSD